MGSEQPLVSFLVITYNQERFIEDAIDSAFQQTYQPLEIIFSDDYSTDRTFDVIRDKVRGYRGPHRIILNRNEKNLGIAGNINVSFSLAGGQFFVMAAGDDISAAERTTALVGRWQDRANPVDLVCSYFEEIDEAGRSTGFIERDVVFTPNLALPVHKWRCGATGACAGYSRMIYDKYGPLDSRVIAEDWIFSFRAWLESGIGLIELPLVKHRTHDACLSVIHEDIARQRDPRDRYILRQKSSGATLARVKEWLRAWQISGRYRDRRLESQLKRWVELLELEWSAYGSSRSQALMTAVRLLAYPYGCHEALRMVVRHVLRMQ